jgi:hypothetical protein
MTLELVISLILLLIYNNRLHIFIIAMLMERHCDRKLWELEQKQKGKYERQT